MEERRKMNRRLVTTALAVLLGLLVFATVGASPSLDPDANAPETQGLQVTVTPTATPPSDVPAQFQVTVTPTATPPSDVPAQFQVTVTPTATPSSDAPAQFQITFLELGYGERVLVSPFSSLQYTLRLPEGWQLLKQSYLDLDLSYDYRQVESLPASFGELRVAVDGQTQSTVLIEQQTSKHAHLRVPLPLELLNDPERRQHDVELFLDAGYLCNVPHKARMVVHPTSLFFLAYQQVPVTVDLAAYPRPFYQRAFEPDLVRFALATQATPGELAGALAIAARLGDLTNTRLAISATTDLEWLARLEAGDPLEEHLIIVGRPERNRLLLTLNQMGVLPVALNQRQMRLASQGPAAVAPGDLFTYTLAVTNTARGTASDLTLVDRLPWSAHFVDCDPACKEEPGQVRWAIGRLSPRETANFTLTLRATDVLTHSIIENTVTLLDAELGPINVDTLTSTLSLSPTQAGPNSSVGDQDGYFFLWNGQAVAEEAGVVQEIVSPWNPQRAVLIVTGLSDQAVYKASQALSFETEFPGMSGPVALISQVRPPRPAPESALASDTTFVELGYGDRTVFGNANQEMAYNFFLPASWRLTDASYLELSFRHSQLMAYKDSSLTVLLNNTPLVSIPLSEESAMGRTLQVKLPASLTSPGENNRLTLLADMSALDLCSSADATDRWLTVSSDSYLHLDHQVVAEQRLDLDLYPYPFASDPHLSDLLFALPTGSRPADWEMALRLAAALGDAAGGPALLPAVVLEEAGSPEVLSGYHIIALGRPAANPWLQSVNAQLPQPFRPGSDEIEQRIDDVVFYLPPGLNLGFIQLIPSPWNEARAFLALAGTTDQGVEGAVNALTDRPWALRGNLALIKEDRINTLDTRELTSSGTALAVATALPEMTPVTTTVTTATPAPSSTPQASGATPSPASSASSVSDRRLNRPERPAWLMPLVGMTGLIIIAIFAIAFWQARRRASRRM
jgi:uncharacterized repeat protein (TIGR01451 family)